MRTRIQEACVLREKYGVVPEVLMHLEVRPDCGVAD